MKLNLNKTEKREERLEEKKRKPLAKQFARFLADLNAALDIEMWAKIDIGSNALHRRLDGLNKVRDMTIEGFPGWKLSFNPEKDPDKLSLGYLMLIYSGEGTNYLVELNRHPDSAARILLKVIEIRNFTYAIIDGMNGIAAKFDKDFNNELATLSEESRAIVDLAVEKAKRAVRIERSVSGIIKKPEWLVFPSIDFTVLAKEKVDEIRKATTTT